MKRDKGNSAPPDIQNKAREKVWLKKKETNKNREKSRSAKM